MTNIVIILILVAFVILALRRARKHFHGGCCGSGSNTIRTHKTLSEPIIGTKVLRIEGMHCENCQTRVENAIDHLDHAACRVNLRKGTATVSYSAEIPDELLRQSVERLGYTVTDIH